MPHSEFMDGKMVVADSEEPASAEQKQKLDQMLAEHSVDELSNYARKLTQDIDRKREELRTMVGERYRDLMVAAESIIQMQESAKGVISATELAISRGQEVNNIAGTTLQISTATSVARLRSLPSPGASHLSAGAQIKLLMAAPEKIWAAQESGAFLKAAQMYLFARHIHTCLTIDTEHSEHSEVLTRFPVISRQWASIAHFHDTILQGCQRTLSSLQPELDSSVQALSAILMLEGFTAREGFDEFLKFRRLAIKGQLGEDKQRATAKSMITQSLRILMSTIQSVERAFLSGGIQEMVQSMKDSPTIDLLQVKSSPILKHLPAIIREYSPTLIRPLDDIDQKYVKTALTLWLDNVHDLIQGETKSVLGHVSSITALSTIRKAIYDMLNGGGDDSLRLEPKTWKPLCERVLGRELNLWEEFYRALFREHTESLIKTQVAGSIYCIQSNVATAVSKSAFVSEEQLADFLWSESSVSKVDILPTKRHKRSNSTVKRATQSLELKSKGYSMQVLSLCDQFDTTLQKMLDELAIFVQKNEDPGENDDPLVFLVQPEAKSEEPFIVIADNEALLQFIQDLLTAQILEMLAYMKKTHISESTPLGLLLFLGRLFQAIPDLCPCLAKCISAPSEFSVGKAKAYQDGAYGQRRNLGAKTDPAWTTLKSKFEDESVHAFNLYVKQLCAQVETSLIKALPEDSSVLLRILPTWDEIEISETTEEGAQVKSCIQVPFQPSVAWFNAVSEYCSTVYLVAPYSLPLQVQQSLSQEAAKTIVSVYDTVSKRAKLGQKTALQLHFDAQLVQQALLTRENRTLAEHVQQVLTQLEAHIDPFDLSVFSPYMTLHVKRAVLRMHGLLSVLVPNDRYGLMASIKSSLASSASEPGGTSSMHNSMWMMSQRQEKIPLIPVPKRQGKAASASSGIPSVGRMSRGSLQPTVSLQTRSTVSPVLGRKKRDKSPLAKATGGFFEAMTSSGWFGSGDNK